MYQIKANNSGDREGYVVGEGLVIDTSNCAASTIGACANHDPPLSTTSTPRSAHSHTTPPHNSRQSKVVATTNICSLSMDAAEPSVKPTSPGGPQQRSRSNSFITEAGRRTVNMILGHGRKSKVVVCTEGGSCESLDGSGGCDVAEKEHGNDCVGDNNHCITNNRRLRSLSLPSHDSGTTSGGAPIMYSEQQIGSVGNTNDPTACTSTPTERTYVTGGRSRSVSKRIIQHIRGTPHDSRKPGKQGISEKDAGGDADYFDYASSYPSISMGDEFDISQENMMRENCVTPFENDCLNYAGDRGRSGNSGNSGDIGNIGDLALSTQNTSASIGSGIAPSWCGDGIDRAAFSTPARNSYLSPPKYNNYTALSLKPKASEPCLRQRNSQIADCFTVLEDMNQSAAIDNDDSATIRLYSHDQSAGSKSTSKPTLSKEQPQTQNQQQQAQSPPAGAYLDFAVTGVDEQPIPALVLWLKVRGLEIYPEDIDGTETTFDEAVRSFVREALQTIIYNGNTALPVLGSASLDSNDTYPRL